MIERLRTRTAAALAVAAIAALGVAGIALAQSSGSSSQVPQHRTHGEAADEQGGAPDKSATDTDHARSGHSAHHEGEDGGTDQGEG
jgi:hypothetical protein